MPAPKLDMTVSLGHILTFVSLAGSVSLGWMSMNGRVATLEASVSAMERNGADSRAMIVEIDRKITSLLVQGYHPVTVTSGVR